MKKINDLTPYKNILPYASEIFGVYQPMLGWKSKRIKDRIQIAAKNDSNHIYDSIQKRYTAKFDLAINERNLLEEIKNLEPATIQNELKEHSGSYIFDSITQNLPPKARYKDTIWKDIIRPDKLRSILNTVVIPKCMDWYKQNYQRFDRGGVEQVPKALHMVATQLNKESCMAGYLLSLTENNHSQKLRGMFYSTDDIAPPGGVKQALDHAYFLYQDPLDVMDPQKDIERVVVSPLAIVHLFRQYFFEFDTFLGPPVSHVWLSPGANVDLYEISTRKITTERAIETSSESIVKTEKDLTEQDDISDAVKEDNKSDIKFGVNTTANQGWIGGSASASASLDMGKTQDKAREQTHKHMRQQTEKLSTEIRKNFKSTFKTTTEITDTSSKRYVLLNSTSELINYELRRKMRQVGVQIQDIGTYLCWQTYVDDPGKQLGVSKLVHLAKSPEMETPPPESIPNPQELIQPIDIQIPFSPWTEDAELDDEDIYVEGVERYKDTNEGEIETINTDFPVSVTCEQPGYEFGKNGKIEDGRIDFDIRGNDIRVSSKDIKEDPTGTINFLVHVSYVNFHGANPLVIGAKIHWNPTKASIDEVAAKNLAKVNEFKEQTKLAFKKAFVDAARERIKKASIIEPRKFEDLREEERIVVYRRLIQQMLTKKIPMPDDRTHHVVAELLNTIFDVDKMLYFVAPEWWRPRLHSSHQGLGGIHGAPNSSGGTVHSFTEASSQDNQIKKAVLKATQMEDKQIGSTDTVSWGGAGRPDNYYITEDMATPAKLGSSLGWLLQLDGDNLRNSFLNAPWVKAVIPIRPGKEKAAINWLQGVEVEGTDGLGDDYVAPPDELAKIPHAGPKATVRDAINYLCEIVAKKHEDSLKVGKYPKDEINDDNKVSATPIDKVYEHGFYPLQGGFRAQSGSEQFEVFDQWVEILPTDQVVPVEVKYDPITGRQVQ